MPDTNDHGRLHFWSTLPLWVLCVIAAMLLWQVFELNNNLRTQSSLLQQQGAENTRRIGSALDGVAKEIQHIDHQLRKRPN
jgi:hypothetical protein